MITTAHRYGNFSSSEIWKLMTNDRSADKKPGKPAQTYLTEKVYEARLGRPIATDSDSRATIWGKFMEGYVHDEKLPLDYKLCSRERLFHPTIGRWTGMPDLIKGDMVVDIKCPQLKSFCELADIAQAFQYSTEEVFIEDISNGILLKDAFPEYYWQLVSNAILTGCDKAELIVFCPFQSELDGIRQRAFAADALEWGNKLYFIQYGEDGELPYIKDGWYYNNLNIINFAVSEEDKAALTARVEWAVNELNNRLS